MNIDKEVIKNQLKKLDDAINNKNENEPPKIEVVDKRYKQKK